MGPMSAVATGKVDPTDAAGETKFRSTGLMSVVRQRLPATHFTCLQEIMVMHHPSHNVLPLPRFISVLAVFLLLVASVGLLMAQDDRPAPGSDNSQLFDRLDTNDDGLVTADEAGEKSARLFRRLLRNSDKDDDGKLSKEEFIDGLKRRPVASREDRQRPDGTVQLRAPQNRPDRERQFKRLDANGDGKIVLDEIPEGRRANFERFFRRLDKDANGEVSLKEFRALPASPTNRPPLIAQPNRGPGGPPRFGDRLFQAIDTDADGTLSPDELKAAAKSLKKLDRDGDGSITRREAAPQQPQLLIRAKTDRPEIKRPNVVPVDRSLAQARSFLKQFDKRDADGDGRLSRKEAPERLREHFARIDTDGDGLIGKAELKKAVGQLMKKAKQQDGRPKTAKSAAVKKAAVKKAAVKKAAVKKDAVKKAAVKKDAVKKKSPTKDGPKKDTPKKVTGSKDATDE